MKKRLMATDIPRANSIDCIYHPMTPPRTKNPNIKKKSNFVGCEFIPKNQNDIINTERVIYKGMFICTVYKKRTIVGLCAILFACCVLDRHHFAGVMTDRI